MVKSDEKLTGSPGKLDIRVGKIISVEMNKKALHPAYLLQIDFGSSLGTKGSSAQLCTNYNPDSLLGKQVLAVVNLPYKRVAGFKSEVLVLAAVCRKKGTILVSPDMPVETGTQLA